MSMYIAELRWCTSRHGVELSQRYLAATSNSRYQTETYEYHLPRNDRLEYSKQQCILFIHFEQIQSLICLPTDIFIYAHLSLRL